jgi:hypothetical protein
MKGSCQWERYLRGARKCSLLPSYTKYVHDEKRELREHTLDIYTGIVRNEQQFNPLLPP